MIHTIQLIHHQNFLDVRKQSADLRHPYGDFYRLDECQILRIVTKPWPLLFQWRMRYEVPPGPLVSKNFAIVQSSDMWVRTVLSSHR